MGDWLYGKRMGWGKKYITSRNSTSSRIWGKSRGIYKRTYMIEIGPKIITMMSLYWWRHHFFYKIKAFTCFLVTLEALITAKNTAISTDFLVWKFRGKAQFPHSFRRIAWNYVETAFPQNFHTRKLGEITVFFAVHRLRMVDLSLERYWIVLYEYQWTVSPFTQFFVVTSA